MTAVPREEPLAYDEMGNAGLEERILDVIAREGMIERDKLVPSATLDSLGVSSVDVVQILMGLEDEFGVYIPVERSLAEVRSVEDLVSTLIRLVEEKQETERRAGNA